MELVEVESLWWRRSGWEWQSCVYMEMLPVCGGGCGGSGVIVVFAPAMVMGGASLSWAACVEAQPAVFASLTVGTARQHHYLATTRALWTHLALWNSLRVPRQYRSKCLLPSTYCKAMNISVCILRFIIPVLDKAPYVMQYCNTIVKKVIFFTTFYNSSKRRRK